jgi:uncharacterized membrane protein
MVARMPFHPERARRLIITSLLAASAFCIALVAARFWYEDNRHFSWLVWNLGLAWIPFLAALSVYDGAKAGRSRARQLAMGGIWLLFLPNAPYLVTDLIHLGRFDDATPLWFDALLLSVFAWTGLFLGLVSLYLIHSVATRAVGARTAWVGAGAALALTGFGVYLGRFERWNSWDVLANPEALFSDIASGVMNPVSEPRAAVVTVAFTAFLAIAYLVVYAFGELGATLGRERRRG